MLERPEELPMAVSPPRAVPSQTNPQTPSKRPASTNDHELTPPHKRSNICPPTPSPQRTAASQARLAAILRAQGQATSESEASTSTLQSTSTFLHPRHPIQASPTSFQPGEPPPTAEQTERHWPPQTPPSIRAAVVQSASEQVGRTIQFSSSPRNGNQNFLGASENVLLDDPFDCPSGSFTGSGGSEPRGPVALSDAEEMSVPDQYLAYSNQVAQYIKLLERRLQAAEKNSEDKARKIERLEEEVDRLRARNKELDSALTEQT
ncbi:hypothetical protein MSAN_00052400 [Mycena sanguinolenta]|uniref:Uncharacterized protein n=1 Tax=Mycena sanguinolenta TaxID=230812 RepID=A0A8H6ZFF0_9AGAR|nr:hypothetical protein MSAN_00052400 [Mycena sanguinolenta]